jgi:iron complex outermembrane receptor protein
VKKILLFNLLLWSAGLAFGQEAAAPSAQTDTTKILNEVVVQAYVYDRPMSEVPAAVGMVSTKDLERFSNTSILPAVNTIPGVRMEERSPGSYRFSIRGSLLRSPFGVRNVKMYWNGLPLTDGGGNTYLNLIDFNAITNAEIIKGPGGSLYGAGTGGVMLLTKQIDPVPQLQFSAMGGSYGLQRYQLSASGGSDKVRASIQFAHQQSDGYRQQTAMRRDAVNADLVFKINSKSTLSATIFYTDLFYETPGGLTKAQFEQDPSMARPTTPAAKGAVDQKAAVYNKTTYAGLVYDYAWNNRWSIKTAAYGSVTSFENPTIRNVEKRHEDNVGGRVTTQYNFDKEKWNGKISFGGEYQYFYSPVKVYDNNLGVAGNIQSNDKLKSNQLLAFAQADLEFPADFFLTLGGSMNFLKYDYASLIATPVINQERKFDPVFSPRVALLKKLTHNLSVYGSVSKGFSPPSLAEVRPSTGSYNNSLNPERGLSYEVGLRGSALNRQVSFDLTAYDFRLDETIVIQRTADGADYFVNAGQTSQRGLEATLSWMPTLGRDQAVSYLRVWGSYTYNHYRFSDYVQDGVNYSGNQLTGVAPNIGLIGVDLTVKKFYTNITTSFTDDIPLNDANSEYAKSYVLVGGRVGYRTTLGKNVPFEVFCGIDNALNKTYSLGNDLNAAGNRYYNAAAPRNYYGGIRIKPLLKKGS